MKNFFIILFLLVACIANTQESLPHGSSPEPIVNKHFPSRMHAYIWRNWNLVNAETLGGTIGCSAQEIEKVAFSMGLASNAQWNSLNIKQLYITIIRRNWHLLPYDQIMSLVEMDEEEMNFVLKEDDFLFYKLGSLKPNALKLEYHIPTTEENQRAHEIRELVRNNFPSINQLNEPRYGFLKDLEKITPYQAERNSTGLRFLYSYFGAFGDPLMNIENNPYPEGLLSQLANQGVNGVWLHVVLNQLSPTNPDFPEFGKNSHKRLAELSKLVDRASKYGIKIYLYMNEPRSMPLEFFENRKNMQGVISGDMATMCTSSEDVNNWIKLSLKHVFTEVKGLGGVFTITASENLTSCASHGLQNNCGRCNKLDYASIIAGINKTIAEGVHAGNPNAKVIVWDWGWNGHGDGREIIKQLPNNLMFMSVSEWAKPINRGNIESYVGEYSISAIGPGPRAEMHWEEARKNEMQTVAKVQFNNTWEISSVPWIPVLDLIAEHASNLTKSEVDAYMLSWSLGGYPSPNLEIANQFSKNPNVSINEVLNNIASERYGVENVDHARLAWKHFSEAFKEFPYHISVLYNAPQQYGPANLLFAESTGYNSTMVCFPYDHLDGWRGPYPRDVFYNQFSIVKDKWSKGLEAFEILLQNVPSSKKSRAIKDYGIAKACLLHFASVANQIKFIDMRDQHGSRQSMLTILKSEIELAKALYEITSNDSRIGFEASNQYYYLPQDLMEKVINCKYLEEIISN